MPLYIDNLTSGYDNNDLDSDDKHYSNDNTATTTKRGHRE